MRGLTSDHAEIKNILLRLRPYENKEQMFLLYQKKKKRWMIGLIVVGIVSALYVHGGSQKETARTATRVSNSRIFRKLWIYTFYDDINQCSWGKILTGTRLCILGNSLKKALINITFNIFAL